MRAGLQDQSCSAWQKGILSALEPCGGCVAEGNPLQGSGSSSQSFWQVCPKWTAKNVGLPCKAVCGLMSYCVMRNLFFFPYGDAIFEVLRYAVFTEFTVPVSLSVLHCLV